MKFHMMLAVTVAGMSTFGTPVRFAPPMAERPNVAFGVEILGGIDGGAATPWNTTTLPDGWMRLTAGAKSVDVLILNGAAVEGGRLATNATWTGHKVHVVRHDVIVPSGVTLTIGSGTVVKFMPETRIWIEEGGKFVAEGARFADFRDDSVGGDTNMDGDLTMPSGRAWWWDEPSSVCIAECRKPLLPCESWTKHGLIGLSFGGPGVETPFVCVWNAGRVFGDALPTVAPPAGFSFAGWRTDAGAVLTPSSVVSAEDVSCLACWEANRYTVQFDANGGYGEMKGQSFVYGVAQRLSRNAFMKAGHVFAGWCCRDAGNVAMVGDGAMVSNLTATANGILKFTAQWVEGDYAVLLEDGSNGHLWHVMGCRLGRVYKLPKWTADKRIVGWGGSNGRRYDDEMLVFDLAKPGESITMSPILE